MSLAENIRKLHSDGWQQSEIIRVTGCSRNYYHAVVGRETAATSEVRARRMGTPQKGTLRYAASNAYSCARSRAEARGLSPAEIKRAARAAYAKVIEEGSHEHA